MRRLLATSAAICALMPAAIHAQERMTLWDVISLDRIVQSGLNSGIGLIRTQMDLQYGDLAVDLRRSRVSMTDITAWPFLDWDETGDCVVKIGRITLLTTPIYALDEMSFKGRVSGLSLPGACFPQEVRAGLEVAGLETVDIPRLTFDIDYGMPKSDALIRVYADVTDVATFDLTGDFSYFWFDGREDMEEPMPVWFLSDATLAVENKGLWASLEPMVPAPFKGAGAGDAVQAMLTEVIQQQNAQSWKNDDPTLSSEQTAFIDSAAETWPAFVAAPETLVLETAIDGDTYIDFEAMDGDLREVFAALKPVVALAPARVSDMLGAELLRAATAEDTSTMSEEDRLRAGMAFVTGAGAPRNIDTGIALLRPLAEGGNGEAGLLIAEALTNSAPEEAYLWALRSGGAGEPGAIAMLDRLENTLPFTRVLELQADVSGDDSHPGSALASISGIREQAVMRLSGNGAARSYGIAAMWAMLAKAAGDPEAADILDEIDGMVRLEGAEARAAWAETEAAYADLAMEVWIGQDLPARYSE